jgi:hypothetical protein
VPKPIRRGSQAAVSDKPIFLDESRLRWRLLRPVLITCAIGLLIVPVILTLSILNVEVLPELKPQQAIAALDRPEVSQSVRMMSSDSRKEPIRAQSVASFSDRWFGGQSEISFSDRWHERQAVLQIPMKSSEHIQAESREHAATMVTSFTE